MEGFNHLQNVIVDDIVFAAMEDSEKRQAQTFFAGWMTETPSGYALVDAPRSRATRSPSPRMKRHDLLRENEPRSKEIDARSLTLVRQLGKNAHEKYERHREVPARGRPGWDEETFHNMLVSYLDLLLSLLREYDQMEDLGEPAAVTDLSGKPEPHVIAPEEQARADLRERQQGP